MRRKIILVALFIVLIFLGGVFLTGVLNGENAYALKISCGSHLQYLLTSYGEKKTGIEYLEATGRYPYFNDTLRKMNISFIVTLYNDYNDYLNDFKQDPRLDISKSLEIAFNKLYIDLFINKIVEDKIYVNMTLTFIDGAAEAGFNYSPKPKINGIWTMNNDGFFTEFNKLIISKNIVINNQSYESLSNNDMPLGEWIFWLNKRSLQQENNIILYNTEDTVIVKFPSEKKIDGVANIIFINNTHYAEEDFQFDGRNIPSSNIIYSNKTLIPPRIIWRDIDENTVKDIINKYKSTAEVCDSCGETFLKSILEPNYTYANHSLYIWDYTPLKSINLSYKSWTFIPTVVSYVHHLSDSKLNYTEYYPGIEYRSKLYLTVGFPLLNSFAYSKDGVLLYMKIGGTKYGNLPELDFILPNAIVKTFAFTLYSNSLYENVILKLVNATSP